MTFREWFLDLDARANETAHARRPIPSGPVEARYALDFEDVKLLREIDAAFTQEASQ